MQLRAQDFYFSQYFANRLFLNPAWAGVDEFSRFTLNYRNQWPSSNNNYVTYSAAYDQYVEQLEGGIGIMVYNDSQGKGVINETGLAAIYSYHLNVSRDLAINAGFQVSYNQRSLNTQNFIFGDMLNPDGSVNQHSSELYGNYKTAYPDFAFGLTGFYKNYYSGAAMYHLLKPSYSASNDPEAILSRKFTFFWGGLFPVYENRFGREVMKLSPNLIYIKQKNHSQLNYGLEGLLKNTYLTGLWIRQNLGIRYSSVIVSAGFVTDKLRMRYSYDYQLSHPAISLPSLGSHEISMIFTFEGKTKITRRTINCLKI